jgi:CubicO group peptidase (beta-lactamase class C family)
MKKQALLLALGLLFHFTNAQQKNDAQLTAYFDQVLSEQFKPNETGATVLVSRNGQVIYEKAFGMANLELNIPMQPDNVFRIASITKQFTAVAILQLMEQGKLNLQDEITRFIPDYPTQGNKITIEHLLTHTSGLPNNTDMPDHMGRVDVTTTEMIDHFKNLPLKFAPGTNWSYSNNGYFLLGYIIEKASGITYAEYLDEHFFKPLEMTHSLYASDTKIIANRADGYNQSDNGHENAQTLSMTHPFAAGAIQSTVGDLFKWHQAVRSYKLIKKETLDKAVTRYKLADGKETAYGYGWRLGNVYEYPSVWHAGLINGFMTIETYLPKEDVFVAIFTNCECNSPVDTASKLAALAAGKPYEYKEIAINNSVLQGYTGVYENQKGQQRIITVSENQLFSQLGRGPKGKLNGYQKDSFFFGDNPMVTIDFTRNKKGTIEKLTSNNLNGNDAWNKTNKPIPSEDGIKVNEALLSSYVGEYEVSPEFAFSVTKEQGSLFLQTPGQEKLEMFAETPTKFFLKVNDAQFEFIKDNQGKVTNAVLNQGGRQANAKKVTK